MSFIGIEGAGGGALSDNVDDDDVDGQEFA